MAPLEPEGSAHRWTATIRLAPNDRFGVYHVVVTASAERFQGIVGQSEFRVTTGSPATVDVPEAPIVALPRYKPGGQPSKRIKVLLVAVDMGSWRALMPMLETGRLPHLAYLMHDGSIASLQSLPGGYFSLPLLTSAITGMVPPRHNILGGAKLYDFNMRRHAWPLWVWAARLHRAVGVVGWPGAWPPDAGTTFDITVPFFAANVFKEKVAYQLINDPSVREFARIFGVRRSQMQRIFELLRTVENYFRTYEPANLPLDGLALRREPPASSLESVVEYFFDDQVVDLADRLSRGRKLDLLTFYIRQVDYLSHAFWKYFEPSLYSAQQLRAPVAYGFDRWLLDKGIDDRGKRQVLYQAYERLDQFVGRFLDASENVIIFSDHGALPGDPQSQPYNIQFLRLAALYYYRTHEELLLGRLNWKQDGVDKRIEFLHAAPADRPIAIRLASFLGRLQYSAGPDSSHHVLFRAVAVGEEGADIVIRLHLDPAVMPTDLLWDGSWSCPIDRLSGFNPVEGVHSMDGILILHGPAFRKGYSIPSASLPDVAPTTAYLMGLPVADDLDGRVVLAAFTPEFQRQHEIERVSSWGRDWQGYWRLIKAFKIIPLLHRQSAPTNR